MLTAVPALLHAQQRAPKAKPPVTAAAQVKGTGTIAARLPAPGLYAHTSPLDVKYDRFTDSTIVSGYTKLAEQPDPSRRLPPDTLSVTVRVAYAGSTVSKIPTGASVSVFRFWTRRPSPYWARLAGRHDGHVLANDTVRVALGAGVRDSTVTSLMAFESVRYDVPLTTLLPLASTSRTHVRIGGIEFEENVELPQVVADVLSRLRPGTVNPPTERASARE